MIKHSLKKAIKAATKKIDKSAKIVMAFGTFDLVHKGHIHFLRQAKKHAGKNGKLVVSIARDLNVKRIKGRKPVFSEKLRLNNLKRLELADKLVFGGKKNYIEHIKIINPDIIVLGYDQTAYTENLKKDLEKAGLNSKVLRAKPHKPGLYKSSKLRAKML